MFRVTTRDYDQTFDRWTDALDAANELKPQCKWLQDVRISDGDDLVWIYSRSHRYPQYIGAGTYDRLVKLFVEEAQSYKVSKLQSKQVTK